MPERERGDRAAASALSAPKKANERYTAAQVIQAVQETRGFVSAIARKLACDPDTVRNYARRYPTVAAALKEERERTTDIAEAALFKAIQEGEAWAVCFYLKTQGKDRGYVERQEHTGANGGPIQSAPLTFTEVVVVLKRETDDESLAS